MSTRCKALLLFGLGGMGLLQPEAGAALDWNPAALERPGVVEPGVSPGVPAPAQEGAQVGAPVGETATSEGPQATQPAVAAMGGGPNGTDPGRAPASPPPQPLPALPNPAASAEAPASSPLPAPDPVANALQARLDALKGAAPRRLPRAEREALGRYYVESAFQPVWIANGTWTSAARTLIARLEQADADGLDPAEYPVPRLGLAAHSDNPGELADSEFRLSAVALLYARDARGGRIELSRISALITPKLELPGAEALMRRLSGASDPGAALGGYNPAYPGYAALRAKLAQARAATPTGPLVRRNPASDATRIASLNALAPAPAPRLEGDLVANMERWRWLPAEVAPRYILVNIPQFQLNLIEDGRSVHEARVIVGRVDSPTPVFSGEVEYAVVNPSWYIPPSIMKKEILPGLAADPDYATKRGYEVVRRGDQISVRQPPGERNALGFIKFMFPNQHAVYLHDTPNRNLFASGMRALSHGCVRVDQPFALADFVLGRDWPEARLRKLIGRGERTLRTPAKLPVHLAYFTMMVDGAGEVKTYGDLYGINRRVRVALGLGA